jgi:hypothetical protein
MIVGYCMISFCSGRACARLSTALATGRRVVKLLIYPVTANRVAKQSPMDWEPALPTAQYAGLVDKPEI